MTLQSNRDGEGGVCESLAGKTRGQATQDLKPGILGIIDAPDSEGEGRRGENSNPKH